MHTKMLYVLFDLLGGIYWLINIFIFLPPKTAASARALREIMSTANIL